MSNSKVYGKEYYSGELCFEHSLSRVWSHAKKGFIMMSAYKTTNTQDVNNRQHEKLKSELKSLGLGYFEVDGVYTYNDGTKGNELSVFIPYMEKYTIEQFEKIAQKLRKDFDQESIALVSPNGESFYIYANRKEKIGNNIGYDKVYEDENREYISNDILR